MHERSIPAVLRERASLAPNDTAFTFIDYDQDPAGVLESLTWAQVYRRSLNVAQELTRHGFAGDRAVILAPQGLAYIAGLLGVLQAGLVAVPLSVPQPGVHDERITAVLRDTSPTVILTTSAFVGNVGEYAVPQNGDAAPVVVDIDALELDSRIGSDATNDSVPRTAYLQYTSGSTRQPTGVMVSYGNLMANFEQISADYFDDYGQVAPPDTTIVSWLPFYHDMGLVLGIFLPILAGLHSVLMSPVAFLQRPSRWIELLASHSRGMSAAPNFAFELAARRTSDADMAGLDLGNVLNIVSGSERIHPATLQRFAKRFAPFNLDATVLRPSYGLAEAMVYVQTRKTGQPPEVVHFDSEQLSAGLAQRCGRDGGTPLVSYGVPTTATVRIVDPDTRMEVESGTVGEIWVHGGNVAGGYWRNPQQTASTFGATLVDPSTGTPEQPWLRTGDLGVISEGELFIIGRIKDLLIMYGRNHYPDDIEATIQEITVGRVAAISVPDDTAEKLVAIIELRPNGQSPEHVLHELGTVRDHVTAAISTSHGLSVADLVLVSPGSIPITTSGKVRRAACVEHYRLDKFIRLDGC